MHRSRVVIACAVAVAAVGCSAETEPTTAELVIEMSGTQELSGAEVEVVLPTGRYTLTITDAQRTLSAEQSGDREEHEAPKGWTYVGLGWDLTGDLGAVGQQALHGTSPRATTVSVDNGARTALLVETPQHDETPNEVRTWALVKEDLAEATVLVEYDGAAQRVDLLSHELDAGPAEGMYDIVAQPVECPDQRVERGPLTYAVDCSVADVVAIPYVADLGWAEQGRTWLLMPLDLQPSAFRWKGSDGPRTLAVEKAETTVAPKPALRLDADPPVVGSGHSTTLVLDADRSSPTTVRLTRRYTLEPASRAGRSVTPRPTFRATLEVPAAEPTP